MSTAHGSRLEEIFAQALDRPPVERAQFVREQCGDDAELLREVESLLIHAADDAFLDSKEAPGRGLLTQMGAQALTDNEPLLPADRRIGPYEVLGALGAGGMGVVYVAQQRRPSRLVAIKIMRRGMGAMNDLVSQRLLRRFEHEAELLGRLTHPGIAQIYEANVYEAAGDRFPYIAMELVKGKPLMEHARDANLDHRARLALVGRVCEAVEHAHRNGIIHRDLKPANILVDGSGQPKVLDFGVARADNAEVAVTSQHTAFGQLIGTLPYMSPEQVAGDSDQVDTRSDVYALGVIIYELLTGKLPYDLTSRPLLEAARLIREQPPTRLSAVDRVFRGDVEVIVSKALDKDRNRRYQSADALRDDLERYLSGQPIAARRDSALYVLGKQLERYRGLVTLGVVSLLLVVSLAVAATWQAVLARTAASEERLARQAAQSALSTAQRERERADENATQLSDRLDVSRVEQGRLLGVDGSLHVAEQYIWPSHLKHPDSRHTFYALWELYMRQPLLATFTWPQFKPVSLNADPSRMRLVVLSDRGELRVWDAREGRVLSQTRLAMPAAPLNAWFVGPDRIFVTDVATYHVMLDASTLAVVPGFEYRPSGKMVRTVAVAPDYRQMLISGNNGVFDCVDTATGRIVYSQRAVSQAGALHMAFSPDGGFIVTGGNDRRVRVWRDLAMVSEVEAHAELLTGVLWTPDGRTIISSSNDRLIRVWDAPGLTLRAVLDYPNGFVRPLSLTTDGRRLLTGGWNNLLVWDLDRAHLDRAIALPAGIIGVAAGAGELAWTVDIQGLRTWDLSTTPGIRALPIAHEGRVISRWSRDGSRIVTADQSGAVRVFDAQTLALKAERVFPGMRARTLDMDPTSNEVAVGFLNDTLMILDLDRDPIFVTARWSRVRNLSTRSIAYSPDGTMIAHGTPQGQFVLRRVPDGEFVRTLSAGRAEAIFVHFSNDGRMLATGNRGSDLRVWDVATGEQKLHVPWASDPWTAQFSVDDQTLFVAGWDRSVTQLNLTTGVREKVMPVANAFVHEVALRPREPMILGTVAADGRLRFLDTSRSSEQCVLTVDIGAGYDALGLDFHPDRPWLLMCDARGQVSVLDLRYFNQHIGGNYRYQHDRFVADGGVVGDAREVDRQMEILEGQLRIGLKRLSEPRGGGGD